MTPTETQQEEMRVFDLYAAAALQGLLSRTGDRTVGRADIAKFAIAQAEAVVTARNAHFKPSEQWTCIIQGGD